MLLQTLQITLISDNSRSPTFWIVTLGFEPKSVEEISTLKSPNPDESTQRSGKSLTTLTVIMAALEAPCLSSAVTVTISSPASSQLIVARPEIGLY